MFGCYFCDYSKHIEVAHIKSVQSFDENNLIGSINSIENLVALCPTHHWEYDNGLLSLTQALEDNSTLLPPLF